ncbi:MAG: prephenate dehydratase [Caldicoprobacterales bacterium]|jgi:prephenate dehydratase|nr:prephenate dehydratase [Clostridiales bacterium]
MKKIGYLGPVGTFTHDAALVYVREAEGQLIEYDSIQELIYAVAEGKVSQGVVPIENAMEGTVNLTIDILVHEVNLSIVKELVIPIQHCLMARKGIKTEDITKVLSHPQALAQCRKFLDKYLKNIKRETTESTAAAAVMVRDSQQSWAAIANYRAADIYGLNILKEGIQDHNGNSTRFVVIAHHEAQWTGRDKTTLAFTVDHKPGSLFRALKIFADASINLTKIESRPMRTLLGQYLFLVDLEGHKDDGVVQEALNQLYKQCKFFKILGSYPRF